MEGEKKDNSDGRLTLGWIGTGALLPSGTQL